MDLDPSFWHGHSPARPSGAHLRRRETFVLPGHRADGDRLVPPWPTHADIAWLGTATGSSVVVLDTGWYDPTQQENPPWRSSSPGHGSSDVVDGEPERDGIRDVHGHLRPLCRTRHFRDRCHPVDRAGVHDPRAEPAPDPDSSSAERFESEIVKQLDAALAHTRTSSTSQPGARRGRTSRPGPSRTGGPTSPPRSHRTRACYRRRGRQQLQPVAVLARVLRLGPRGGVARQDGRSRTSPTGATLSMSSPWAATWSTRSPTAPMCATRAPTGGTTREFKTHG